MRVAVISAVSTCGKSTLCEVLGGVYARSQGRDAVIFSTGDARDNIDIITNLYSNRDLDNAYIIKSMIDNVDSESAKSLLNYGVKAGDEHVFIYDILNAVMPENDKHEFLLNAIKRIPANLTLIEICGDVTSELNKAVLELCDCSIVLTDCSLKGIKAAPELYNKIDNIPCKHNTALVMSKLNPIVASDKKLAELLKIKVNNLFKFPYNPIVAKLAIDGNLDRVIYNITHGDYEVSHLMTPIQELMEFIFNSETRRVIRGVDKWFK